MTKIASISKTPRKQCTPEFHDEALNGATARELSLHESLLYNWRSK